MVGKSSNNTAPRSITTRVWRGLFFISLRPDTKETETKVKYRKLSRIIQNILYLFDN